MTDPLFAPPTGLSHPFPPPLPSMARLTPPLFAAAGPPEQPERPSPGRRKGLGLVAGLAAVAAVVAASVYFYSKADPERATLSSEVAEPTPDTLTTVAPPVATAPVTTVAAATTSPETTVAPTTTPETSAPETTVAGAPETTLAAIDPATLPLPSDGVAVIGATGWTMLTAPSWTIFDIPNFNEEIAWATGGGVAGFGSNINVLSETPEADIDMATYVELSLQTLSTIAPAGTILSRIIPMPDGRELARIEYVATFGREIHFLVYILKSQASFIVATFGAPPELYAAEVPTVEPYLVTLTAGQP